MKKIGLTLVPAMVTMAALWLSTTAQATGIVYWANYGDGTISHASLNGTGGGQLNTGGAYISDPIGVALDPLTGWIYWSNGSSTPTYPMAWADLDNSGGGGNITITGGASVSFPTGLAVDPAARMLYWSNYNNDTIAHSNLYGGASADLSTPGVTPDSPDGVAVDPALGEIFWTNEANSTIGWARLNGSGGGTLATGAAPLDHPSGLAIDPKNNRIYWANLGQGAGTTIGWANLDGSGGGTLDTSGATVKAPIGIAVDPTRGLVYWANYAGGPISYAGVNGGGGANLPTPGAPSDGEQFPVLLFPPVRNHRPHIAGGKTAGSELRCTQTTWERDVVESFYYRSPTTRTYSWLRNGHRVRHASKATYRAKKKGLYNCAVTASNAAGSTETISKPHILTRRHK